jgi:hypothetical protein
MTIPMMLLAASCVLIGIFGTLVIQVMSPVLGVVLSNSYAPEIKIAASYLFYVTVGSVAFIILLIAIAGLRSFLLARRPVGETVTWDCGYAAPTARMQYTASSFAQPIIELFHFFLRTKKHITIPGTYFPTASNFETHTPDISRESIYNPIFKAGESLFLRMRVVQEGRIHIYVLYVVVTLLILLFWNMR